MMATHGLAFRSDKELFIADFRRGILSYRLGEKEPSVICDKPAGASFKGVSDIAIDEDGCVWFSDPDDEPDGSNWPAVHTDARRHCYTRS